MTTQNNVVTPEIKSCINNLISTTVLPSATTVPESMAMLGGFLNFSHNNNNLIKRLEGSKVNAWIDSMRASSPTRTTNKSSENQEKCSWIVSIYIYTTITLFLEHFWAMLILTLFMVCGFAALSSFSFEIV
jgi:hypothetical protein